MERFFADVIRGARERRGITQAQLAEKCGRSQPNVARWESGREPLVETTLEVVAQALGVSMRDLFVEQLVEDGLVMRAQAKGAPST